MCPILPPLSQKRLPVVLPHSSTSPVSPHFEQSICSILPSLPQLVLTIPDVSDPDSTKFNEEEDDQAEYEIEKLLNHRGIGIQTEYLVKWKGYPHSANTWESLSNLTHCAGILEQYNILHNIPVPIPHFVPSDSIIDFDELAQSAEPAQDLVEEANQENLEKKYDPDFSPFTSTVPPDIYEIMPPYYDEDSDDSAWSSTSPSTDPAPIPIGAYQPLTDESLLSSLALAQQVDNFCQPLLALLVHGTPLPLGQFSKSSIIKNLYLVEEDL